MRSFAFADLLIGVGLLFVLEGLIFAASPNWMRRAMKSALETPDNVLRAVGIGSAVGFVTALVVVKVFVAVVTKIGFAPFAWYRIALGAAGLAWLAMR